MDATERCDFCGDRGDDDDPVVEYSVGEPGGTGGNPRVHISCATEQGWED